jgi:large subunit ribosomal protein L35
LITEEEWAAMPKLKTHKGMKKRFKVSATGKVSHKRCGSSHLNSHKSGKRVRRLRKSTQLKVTAEAKTLIPVRCMPRNSRPSPPVPRNRVLPAQVTITRRNQVD